MEFSCVASTSKQVLVEDRKNTFAAGTVSKDHD